MEEREEQMMRNAAEFRRMAREALKGRWGLAVLASLIAALLGGTASDIVTSVMDTYNAQQGVNFTVPLISFAVSLFIGSVVTIGYAWFNLELIDGGEPSISSLFAYFSCWKTAVAAQLLATLYIFLWTLLLIIPGIVASFSYAMVHYVLADDPDLTAREALARSKKIMEGNRFRLFCLVFSFIGWDILCIFTLGIGYLWLIPYQEAAIAAFYREISGTEKLHVDEELLEDKGWPGLSD